MAHRLMTEAQWLAHKAMYGRDRQSDNGAFDSFIASKPSKFGNVKVDGYDSKRERDRCTVLRLMQEAGAISNLREKVVYILIPAQYVDGKCVERACTYTADFVYEDAGGRTVVEDVKGYPNDRWPIKRKLMLHIHGIRVQEVK